MDGELHTARICRETSAQAPVVWLLPTSFTAERHSGERRLRVDLGPRGEWPARRLDRHCDVHLGRHHPVHPDASGHDLFHLDIARRCHLPDHGHVLR